MSSEGFLKELQTIGEKLLLKLQRLPKADPVEIVSFCVVLLFIGECLVEAVGLSECLFSSIGAACSTIFVAVVGSCAERPSLIPTVSFYYSVCISANTQITIGNSRAFSKALIFKHYF